MFHAHTQAVGSPCRTPGDKNCERPPAARIFRAMLLCACFCLLAACAPREPGIKNLILVIGDGAGLQEIGLAMTYARYAHHSTVAGRRLHLERVMADGTAGILLTHPYGALVTDSAASTTQLATGRYALLETLGLDEKGNRAETIMEKARRAGKSTGLVSDTRITHATPAAFVVHRKDRFAENDIAVDLVDSGTDVMLSGGLRHFLPASAGKDRTAARVKLEGLVGDKALSSARTDSLDLLDRARRRGYELVFTRKQLTGAGTGRILGLFTPSEMPDAITVHRMRLDRGRRVPTLREMTEKALAVLSRNRKGFFLMVEAGLIDTAGHHSDAGRLLHEVLVLDEVVGFLGEWVKQRDDTLLVIAADHETGGFGFAYSRYRVRDFKAAEKGGALSNATWNYVDPRVLDGIYGQAKSFDAIRQEFNALPPARRTPRSLMRIFNDAVNFHITLDEAGEILAMEENEYHDPAHRELKARDYPRVRDFKEFYVTRGEMMNNLMGRAIARQQGVVWSAGTHTASPVLVVAFGPAPYSKRFAGVRHSTEAGRLMIEALGVR